MAAAGLLPLGSRGQQEVVDSAHPQLLVPQAHGDARAQDGRNLRGTSRGHHPPRLEVDGPRARGLGRGGGGDDRGARDDGDGLSIRERDNALRGEEIQQLEVLVVEPALLRQHPEEREHPAHLSPAHQRDASGQPRLVGAGANGAGPGEDVRHPVMGDLADDPLGHPQGLEALGGEPHGRDRHEARPVLRQREQHVLLAAQQLGDDLSNHRQRPTLAAVLQALKGGSHPGTKDGLGLGIVRHQCPRKLSILALSSLPSKGLVT